MAKKKNNPKVIIFSGVRQLNGLAQFPYIDDIINSLRGSIFITGGAPGIDTIACVGAFRAFPKAKHIVVLPWRYALNQVHVSWCEQKGIEVLDMPRPLTMAEHPNLVRNSYMLKLGQKLAEERKIEAILVAFPGGPSEVLRSGTWSTIRRAEKLGITTRLYPLSEAPGSKVGGNIHE